MLNHETGYLQELPVPGVSSPLNDSGIEGKCLAEVRIHFCENR